MKPKILVLQGANLNLLGTREPEIYGTDTLNAIHERLASRCHAEHIEFEAFQTNFEGELINKIHAARLDGTRVILINPAAWTHSSIALRDALAGIQIPFIEIHLSNIYAREPFRHHSYFSDLASGIICGLGTRGYDLALDAALSMLKMPRKS